MDHKCFKTKITSKKAGFEDVNNIYRLIRLYRANTCLWYPKSSGYGNYEDEKNAWERITKVLGPQFTVDEVKKQVQSLCDYFYKERLRIADTCILPKRPYYHDLEFLECVGCVNNKISDRNYIGQSASNANRISFSTNVTADRSYNISTNPTDKFRAFKEDIKKKRKERRYSSPSDTSVKTDGSRSERRYSTASDALGKTQKKPNETRYSTASSALGDTDRKPNEWRYTTAWDALKPKSILNNKRYSTASSALGKTDKKPNEIRYSTAWDAISNPKGILDDKRYSTASSAFNERYDSTESDATDIAVSRKRYSTVSNVTERSVKEKRYSTASESSGTTDKKTSDTNSLSTTSIQSTNSFLFETFSAFRLANGNKPICAACAKKKKVKFARPKFAVRRRSLISQAKQTLLNAALKNTAKSFIKDFLGLNPFGVSHTGYKWKVPRRPEPVKEPLPEIVEVIEDENGKCIVHRGLLKYHFDKMKKDEQIKKEASEKSVNTLPPKKKEPLKKKDSDVNMVVVNMNNIKKNSMKTRETEYYTNRTVWNSAKPKSMPQQVPRQTLNQMPRQLLRQSPRQTQVPNENVQVYRYHGTYGNMQENAYNYPPPPPTWQNKSPRTSPVYAQHNNRKKGNIIPVQDYYKRNTEQPRHHSNAPRQISTERDDNEKLQRVINYYFAPHLHRGFVAPTAGDNVAIMKPSTLKKKEDTTFQSQKKPIENVIKKKPNKTVAFKNDMTEHVTTKGKPLKKQSIESLSDDESEILIEDENGIMKCRNLGTFY